MLEYIQFLYPIDGIQKLFFFLIAGLSIGTTIWVLIVAKKKNWEYNWLGETPEAPQDDLDVEHGSVFDLSEAIATRGEKFAAVLPSMLLIIGLLGTFLGVGFSLDAAAGILGNKGEDPIVLLQKMMPMLDGMGALFKSSIYGIIFFFLFSTCRSIMGTDKKRLKFCIEKCNELIAKKRKEEKDPIINALEDVSKSLGNSLQDVLIKVLNEGMLHISESLNGINEKLGKTIQNTISKGFNSVTDNLTETTNSLNSLNNTMTQSFKSVEKSAKKMESASTSLIESVDKFTPSVQATLKEIQEQFVASIEESGKIMKDAGVSIKEAVEVMAKETSDGQEKLRDSLASFQQTLAEIMGKIATMTNNVGVQARSSETAMKQMHDEICGRLDVLSSSNVTLRDAVDKMPLDELKAFLAESMKKMKESNVKSSRSKEQSQKKNNPMEMGRVMESALFPWPKNKG